MQPQFGTRNGRLNQIAARNTNEVLGADRSMNQYRPGQSQDVK